LTADRPTVLYVDHAAALGGAEFSLLSLLDHLDPTQYRPVLAAPNGELAVRAAELGVTTHILDLPQLRGHLSAPMRLAAAGRRLRRLARGEGAWIVHANTYRASVYAAFAARSGGRAMVWHVRDMLGGPVAWLLCRRAAAVIAISRAVALQLGCDRKTSVIYNPISSDGAAALDRRDLGLPLEGPLVASIGRLRPWKGHDTFLEAAAQVGHPDAQFLVIGGKVFDDGEPDIGGDLEQLAGRLGIGDRTWFLGQRHDLQSILPHLSVVVHAAHAEPFGRAVAEAQLHGVPVVAFADGGVPEIVVEGVSGLLVPPGATAVLAQGVHDLLSDPEARDRMGAAARNRALRLFDADRHARQVEAVYARVLGTSA
jgi:glycosyltransferase involved in cell wall biosynthesis